MPEEPSGEMLYKKFDRTESTVAEIFKLKSDFLGNNHHQEMCCVFWLSRGSWYRITAFLSTRAGCVRSIYDVRRYRTEDRTERNRKISMLGNAD